MPTGDFDWASRGIAEDLGQRWHTDKMGNVLLHNALYGGRMSPDLREMYQNALQDYMQRRYSYDFDDLFDWDTYRRSYGATH